MKNERLCFFWLHTKILQIQKWPNYLCQTNVIVVSTPTSNIQFLLHLCKWILLVHVCDSFVYFHFQFHIFEFYHLTRGGVSFFFVTESMLTKFPLSLRDQTSFTVSILIKFRYWCYGSVVVTVKFHHAIGNWWHGLEVWSNGDGIPKIHLLVLACSRLYRFCCYRCIFMGFDYIFLLKIVEWKFLNGRKIYNSSCDQVYC